MWNGRSLRAHCALFDRRTNDTWFSEKQNSEYRRSYELRGVEMLTKGGGSVYRRNLRMEDTRTDSRWWVEVNAGRSNKAEYGA